MMPFVNTTLSVLRGTGYDSTGDPVDTGAVFMAGVPAGLGETSQRVMDPATQMPRTIRTAKAVVPDYVQVLTTDQILDESTGDKYMVIEVLAPKTLAGPAGMRQLVLKRVTSAGT
jgi:hypothetical protein